MESKGTTCAFQFASERSVSRVWYGISSSPIPWKRGPLAPVVVVGEGQVNLVYGRCSGHGESLQSFVGRSILMMNQIDPPVATLAPMEPGVASGCSHGDYRGL